MAAVAGREKPNLRQSFIANVQKHVRNGRQMAGREKSETEFMHLWPADLIEAFLTFVQGSKKSLDYFGNWFPCIWSHAINILNDLSSYSQREKC